MLEKFFKYLKRGPFTQGAKMQKKGQNYLHLFIITKNYHIY